MTQPYRVRADVTHATRRRVGTEQARPAAASRLLGAFIATTAIQAPWVTLVANTTTSTIAVNTAPVAMAMYRSAPED